MKRVLVSAAVLIGWAVLVGLPAESAAAPGDGHPGVPKPDPSGSGPIRFNRDIRPILSDNCFACHGPDSAKRKAGLRLDREEGLFGKAENGIPIVKGKPQESAAYQRITSDDPDEQMPPPKSLKKLTPQQKDLIGRWIEQGAPWEAHWSLVAPVRPVVPQVTHPEWVRNPIDRFVLARLDAEGLEPAPEADRRALIRRVSLDLTGLPPTPQEVEAFINDLSFGAYERVVDRLLASPRYGEHRARYWLDAARYGDTHGIHMDNQREIWPYRDWVIDAFNRNLPFDRFTVEQIAGDLLPNHTLDQQIATGFHRCNITTSEGGAIDEEFEAIYAKDRVETTGLVWLGLTLGCASCHDHKFDPVTQKEFYQFAAYFRNTTQRAMDGNVPDTPPNVVVPSAADRPRWESLQKELAALTAEREKRKTESQTAFEAWAAGGEAKALCQPLDPSDEHLAIAADGGEENTVAVVKDGKESSLPMAGGLSWGEGLVKDSKDKALHFAPKGSLEITKSADFDADQPFSVGGWVYVPSDDGAYVIASKVDGKGKGGGPGWMLELNGRTPIFRLSGKGANNVIQVRGRADRRLPGGKWAHVVATYDGSRGRDGLALYVNGNPEPGDVPEAPALKGSIRTESPLRVGSDGTRDFHGGGVQDFRIYRHAVMAEEAVVLAKWESLRKALTREDSKLTDAERQDLKLLYLVRVDEPYRTATARLTAATAEQRQIRRRSPETLVMQEKPDYPPTAYVLFRGQYDQKRDKVTAGTPAALHPYPADWPKNRLGLAWWLVDAKNPLTSRVTVNRFWQEVFGQGIVRTAEDFGVMGENPSHPELLDWLAVEFRESGWDIKHMMRLMVTSAAYRQSAAATPEKLKKDPTNRLLSRGPRFRMDAEVLRDSALAESGLLVDKIGGPSVKPYQPAGVWEAVAMFNSNTRFYKQDTGESLYRRSLYTYWKRAAPPASMEIFNAPTRESCTVRRERTNTPLQALATMNDPQWVEAARRLAERAILELPGSERIGRLPASGAEASAPSETLDRRLDFITEHVVARPYDERERRICRSVLEDFLSTYQRQPEAAAKLIHTGESKPDAKAPPAELAAWTMLASQVMNTDEALNK